jgi:hypothetical protein
MLQPQAVQGQSTVGSCRHQPLSGRQKTLFGIALDAMVGQQLEARLRGSISASRIGSVHLMQGISMVA